MRREHGPHVGAFEQRAYGLGIDTQLDQAVDGLGETTAIEGPFLQARHTVDLLGHVRQVEVHGERPDEQDRLDVVDALETLLEVRFGDVARLVGDVAGHRPDLFDQIEEVLPLLMRQRCAELTADSTDVVPE